MGLFDLAEAFYHAFEIVVALGGKTGACFTDGSYNRAIGLGHGSSSLYSMAGVTIWSPVKKCTDNTYLKINRLGHSTFILPCLRWVGNEGFCDGFRAKFAAEYWSRIKKYGLILILKTPVRVDLWI
jgi:hypothetical protein